VAAIGSLDWCTTDGLIVLQIFVRDEAAVGLHVGDNKIGCFSGVEACCSVGSDAFKRLGEICLNKTIASLIRFAGTRELGEGSR